MTNASAHWQRIFLVGAFVLVVVLVVAAAMSSREDDGQSMRDAPSTTSSAQDSQLNVPVASESAVKILVIGDSVTEGTEYGGRGVGNWTSLVQGALRTEVLNACPVLLRVSGRGGSGYATAGTRSTTFASETERLMTPDVSAVVYVGSGNDLAQLSSTYVDTVVRTLAVARSKNPDAAMVVIGPSWIHDEPIGTDYQLANELLGEAARDAGAAFVDPNTAGWFKDASAADVVGADDRHPTDAGHAVIARNMAPIIEDLGRNGRCL